MAPVEVMQMPATDETVMVARTRPIRAKKASYYKDLLLIERALPPPVWNKATPRNCL
jgi:type IV secretion system protein VirD4